MQVFFAFLSFTSMLQCPTLWLCLIFSHVHVVCCKNGDPVKKIHLAIQRVRYISTGAQPVLFLYITAHGVQGTDPDSALILLQEDPYTTFSASEMSLALRDLHSPNLIMFFDFCMSDKFLEKTSLNFKAFFQMSSSLGTSYNSEGRQGFFSQCLINGIRGAVKCILGEGARDCQFCDDFRRECSFNGVITLQSLAIYVRRHVECYTDHLKRDSFVKAAQQPNYAQRGEVPPIAFYQPVLEVRVDGRVVDKWTCSLDDLNEPDTNMDVLIGN